MDSNNNNNNGKRKVKLSELEKENNDKKIINSNIKEKQTKDSKPKDTSKKNNETADNKTSKDISDKKESSKKVVPLSEVTKKNEEKINKVKAKQEETSEEDKPKREKVKLDDLIKENKEKEAKKKKEEDVIVNFNEKKQEAKNAIKKNKNTLEKEKSKTKKDIAELSSKKDKDIDTKENKKQKDEEKEDVNLDVLGVKRVKQPSKVMQKIKEVLITVVLFIIGIFLIMILPIFNVPESNMNVTGLDLLSKNEILNAINYDKSSNLFHLILNKPEEKIKTKVPMVNDCEVKFEFPNTVNIRITEIRLAGYIPYLDQYIYIDSYGKVVSSQDEKIDGIPLIEGLNFTSLKVGNILKVSNSDALNVIIEITNVLNKYELSNMIDSIDVTSLDNLKLYVGNIEVILGEIEDYDQKIRMAMEAINNLSAEAKGVLNVSSSSGKIYFRPYS